MSANNRYAAAPLILGVITGLSICQVTSANMLVNGGFEAPADITGSQFVAEASVPGWETDDSAGTIELWRSGSISGIPSNSGLQLSELNGQNSADAPFNYFQVVSGVVPGSDISWSFYHRRRATSGTESLRLTVSNTNPLVNHVSSATTSQWVMQSGQTTADTSPLRFEFTSVSPAGTVGNLLDDAVLNSKACRILRLKSTSVAGFFGTGAFIADTTNAEAVEADGNVTARYGITMKTNEGMFDGRGLIYNDGQFPADCANSETECFPNQDTFKTARWDGSEFDLTNLKLLSTNGTIVFGNGTYTYTKGKFDPSPHTGTYKTVACGTANPAPTPSTLYLLLLPPVLWFLTRRFTRSRRLA